MPPKRSRTSLESQLAKLHTPQTDSIRETKLRVSFLYTAQSAAGIDCNTHYANTRAAFESLVQIDPQVAPYGESLFSEQSKQLDRSTLTKEQSDDLNADIQTFLMCFIAPHFTLSSTHKLLEWLVFKYEIVAYNCDDLLCATIPYHETLLFVRVVQMCGAQIKKNSADNYWSFLTPLLASGTPLTRQTIVTHCVTNKSFFSMINDKFNAGSAKSDTFLTFYISLLFGILNDGIDENVAGMVLAAIQDGLDSKDWTHVQSIYALIGFLVTKTTLSDSILRRILKRMTKQIRKRFRDQQESITAYWQVMSIVTAYQDVKTLPSNALDLLPEQLPGLITDSAHLMQALIRTIIANNSDSSQWAILTSILENVSLKPELVSLFMEEIFQLVTSDSTNELDQENISSLLSIVERSYPAQFDKFLSNKEKVTILGPYLTSFKFSPTDGSGTNLVDGISHASLPIRIASYQLIKYKLSNFDANPEECDIDLDFIRTSFMRSLDDEPEVALMSFPLGERLKSLVSETKLTRKLKSLLARCQREKLKSSQSTWFELEEKILKELNTIGWDNEFELMTVFLNYITPNDERELGLLKLISESKHTETGSSFGYLQGFFSKPTKKFDRVKIFDKLTNGLAQEYLYRREKGPLVLEYITAQQQPPLKWNLFGLAVLNKIFSSDIEQQEDQYNSCGILYTALIFNLLKREDLKKSSHTKYGSDLTALSLAAIEASQPSLSLVFHHLSRLISCIRIHDPKTEEVDPLSTPKKIHKSFLTPLFDFLFEQAESDHSRVAAAFQELIKTAIECKPSEMSTIATSFCLCFTNPKRQCRALSVLRRLPQVGSEPKSLMDFSALLLALVSSDITVRRLAIKMMEDLSFVEQLTPLLEPLRKNASKIENDPDRVSDVALLWIEKFVKEERSTGTEWLALVVQMIRDPDISYGIKLGLLRVLRKTDSDVIAHIQPIFHGLLAKESLNSIEFQCAKSFMEHCTHCLAASEDLGDVDHVAKLFVDGLKSPQMSKICLGLCTVDWFHSIMCEEIKMSVLNGFMDLFEIERAPKMVKIFKQITYDGKILSRFINETFHFGGENDLNQSLKRFKPVLSTTSRNSKRCFLLLEAAQESTTLLTHHSRILKNLTQLVIQLDGTDGFGANLVSDYERHVILKLINRCLIEDENCIADIKIEPIIHCLRDSQSREVKRICISILSKVTSTFKHSILDSMVDIFAYLGDTIKRANDEMTMGSINEIMILILAPLIAEQKSIHDKIIEIFIDDLSKIPIHRRSALFKKLIEINPDCSLDSLVLKMVQRLVDSEEGPDKVYLRSFIVEFILNHKTDDLLTFIEQASQIFVAVLRQDTHRLLDGIVIERMGRAEFANCLILLLCDILGSHEFVAKISEIPPSVADEPFERILEKGFEALELSAPSSSKRKSISRGTETKSLCLKLVQRVNQLLPSERIFQLVGKLLEHEQIYVRLHAIQILDENLEQSESVDPDILTELLPCLGNTIELAGETGTESEVKCAQEAMHSIVLIVSRMDCNPQTGQSLDPIMKEIFRANFRLRAIESFASSSLICSSIMASRMDIHAIPYLSQIIEILLEQFKLKNELHIATNVTSLASLSGKFASYLGPHIEALILFLVRICGNNDGNQEIILPAQTFMKNVVKNISHDSMLASLEASFESLNPSEEGRAIYWFGNFVRIYFESISKVDLSSSLGDLQRFVMKMMDYRSLVSALEKVDDATENSILDSIMTFIPKLSEITFRPLLYSLFDWADKCDAKPDRMVTFYRLMEIMSHSLKSLFCQFAAPYITVNCCQLLDENNVSKNKDLDQSSTRGHLLILAILRTLSNCFLHDINSTYLTIERSQSLIKPIIGQLSNTGWGKVLYLQRVTEALNKCVENLVASLKHSSVLKKINYELMLQTRADSVEVRLSALELVERMVTQMQESYSDLLSDSVPTLVELVQDSDERVEKRTNELLTHIEQTTGQAMDKYF